MKVTEESYYRFVLNVIQRVIEFKDLKYLYGGSKF